MAAQEIKVPDIGDFDAVEIIEVLVSEGDEVEQEQALITLESDKATLEVPSTAAGRITQLKIKEGDKVSEGDVIALLEPADASGSDDQTDDAAETKDAADEAKASRDDTEGEQAKTETQDAAGEPSSSRSGGGGQTQEIKVPDIGDFDAVEIIEVLVSEGDEVEQEQALITLESDKATLEVPSSAAGKITQLKIAEGDNVSEGDVIAVLETAGEAPKRAESSESAQTTQKPPAPGKTGKDVPQDDVPLPPAQSASGQQASGGDSSTLETVDEQGFAKAHASPSVRYFARKLGVDLSQVSGSGRKGRILEEDVQVHVRQILQHGAGAGAAAPAGGGGLPAQPDIDYSQFGDVETVELARIRKHSGRAVHRNWLLIPHVTQYDEADITEMESFRKANKERAAQEGVRLTPLAFLLKASAAALKAFPDMNSSLTADGEHLVHKKYYHIAVAVDTDAGLVMPVIRDVDQKGIYQLARDLENISHRAREGALKSEDMKGASFSISSLGSIGGTAFTPIVNSPEVAILGAAQHSWQPVWQDGEFVPRLMLPLALSYDHRVLDGAEGVRITRFFRRALSELRTLLL